MKERIRVDGGGGGQIGWVWGWSGVGWWSVAARSANALESLVEHGLRSIRLSRSELNLYSSVHDWRSEMWVLGVCGSVMREGWSRSLLDQR